MRTKKKLEWYALIYDFNNKKIRYYNVLYEDMIDSLKKKIKKGTITTYADVKEHLKRDFTYHYWGRCEYEIMMSGLSRGETTEKIDIWYQLQPNLDRITEYVIRELKLEDKLRDK
jgi:hypothetical protein